MSTKNSFKLVFILLIVCSINKSAAISSINLIDDNHHLVSLKYPAKRIISLSPHITELIYEAGGENYLVGTVNSSNYPPQVKHIEKIGNSQIINVEKIMALKPDLIVAWNNSPAIEKIRKLDASINYFISHPNKIKDISDNLIKLGKLMNTEKIANQSAIIFDKHISRISNQYNKGNKEHKTNLLFLISKNPYIAYSGGDLLFQNTIKFCNGKNILDFDKRQAIIMSLESVKSLKPDIIFSSKSSSTHKSLATQYNTFWSSQIDAVQNELGQTIDIEADLIARPGPRYWKGMEKICYEIDRVSFHKTNN